jgi:hypothetical protein
MDCVHDEVLLCVLVAGTAECHDTSLLHQASKGAIALKSVGINRDDGSWPDKDRL